jgi:hypothetical protein
MTKPLSDQKNINTIGNKTNKDIEIPMDSNIDPKNVIIIYCVIKKQKKIAMSSDS